MRWKGRAKSTNVEDRRGGRGGRGKKMAGGLGLGTIIIILLALFLGEDPSQLLQNVDTGGGYEQSVQQTGNAAEDELAEFVSVVLKYTENTWHTLFPKYVGKRYREPVLVLYSGAVRSACGNASSSTGPFYCPGDEKLYIDLSFYNDLKNRFGAPGDFAMAYVVAHEVAHHVQNLLGYTRQVSAQRGRVSKAEYNQLSVRLELQADFYAGVWAHHAQKMENILEWGDIEEAMTAAKAIGDDRLQMRARGYVVPETFTHGTSAQRARWFKKGLETGDMTQGDTFSARTL